MQLSTGVLEAKEHTLARMKMANMIPISQFFDLCKTSLLTSTSNDHITAPIQRGNTPSCDASITSPLCLDGGSFKPREAATPSRSLLEGRI